MKVLTIIENHSNVTLNKDLKSVCVSLMILPPQISKVLFTQSEPIFIILSGHAKRWSRFVSHRSE